MRVRDATVLGLLTGMAMNLTYFSYVEEIKFINLMIGVLSIILGRKIIKGPPGGFLFGLGIGISLGALVSLYI